MAAEFSFKNQFLLAMPGLTGSYFGDTLTYICEHNAEGAMGIMVNRPSHISLIELLAQLGIDKGHTPVEVRVMEGGPVASDQGFILHSTEIKFESSLALDDGLSLSSAREVIEAIANDEGPEDYLVALGYAGWGRGQLEDEVADNAWLTCPADTGVIFNTPFTERVNKAASILGIDFALMSGQAGHA
ncbi:MAG: YqgE/AlgH family protein [Pseudomonadales bacterium]